VLADFASIEREEDFAKEQRQQNAHISSNITKNKQHEHSQWISQNSQSSIHRTVNQHHSRRSTNSSQQSEEWSDDCETWEDPDVAEADIPHVRERVDHMGEEYSA